MIYKLEWKSGKKHWHVFLTHAEEYSDQVYRKKVHSVMRDAAYALLRTEEKIGLENVLQYTAKMLVEHHGFQPFEFPPVRVVGFGGGDIINEKEDSDLESRFGDELLEKIFLHNEPPTPKKEEVKEDGKTEMANQEAEFENEGGPPRKEDSKGTGGKDN